MTRLSKVSIRTGPPPPTHTERRGRRLYHAAFAGGHQENVYKAGRVFQMLRQTINKNSALSKLMSIMHRRLAYICSESVFVEPIMIYELKLCRLEHVECSTMQQYLVVRSLHVDGK